MKTMRDYLNEYTEAHRCIEVAGIAITMLETISTAESMAAVRTLKRGQHKNLKRLDAAAARLGAPYPPRPRE